MTDTQLPGRPPVHRRISEAISQNPIGALILMTATISAVFYTTLSLAWNNLNTSASRFDRMFEDINTMKFQIAKLDSIEKAVQRLPVIQQQLDAMRPFEVRMVESFGVKTDDDLPIVLYRGHVVAVPQTNEHTAELGTVGFRRTPRSFVIKSNTANGWLLPQTDASDLIPTGSVPPRRPK